MPNDTKLKPKQPLPEDNREYKMLIPQNTEDKVYNAKMTLANAQNFTQSVERQAAGDWHPSSEKGK